MKSVKFKQRQNNILSTFKTTIDKMASLISEIDKEKEIKTKERDEINVEIKALDDLRDENSALKTKFEEFITVKKSDVKEEE